jgi:uncharacterized Ntn-hydrolase superfamily protein
MKAARWDRARQESRIRRLHTSGIAAAARVIKDQNTFPKTIIPMLTQPLQQTHLACLWSRHGMWAGQLLPLVMAGFLWGCTSVSSGQAIPGSASRDLASMDIEGRGAVSVGGRVVGLANASDKEPLVATYSIAAFDPESGDLGVAVQSKYFGVGGVVPWAKAGVGAIATQASANVRYGPEGLKLLAEGRNAKEVVHQLTEADERRAIRQLGVVDAQGRAFAHTGAECLSWAGHIVGTNFTAQGNILAGEAVVRAMAEAYEQARRVEGSQLADWLCAALQAGEDAGGDTRGRQSAVLLVVRDGAGPNGVNDRFIDLRVEDHADPTKELSRLLEIHKKFHAGKHRTRPVRAR